jgi:glutathione synthase/RimK-type ligase-like ATP-grasp enzyme
VERVALVTSERGLRLDPELSLAADALRADGLDAVVVRWDDTAVDWNGYALAVIRSTWDYSWRLTEFLAWADAVPRLRNSVALLRWNTDKTYLRDLERAGLPVVPTVWDPTDADALPDAEEWVVKPSISAGSRDTARWADRGAALAHAAELTGTGRTAMLQPYLSSVDELGETALLFLGGRVSHAVRKGPLLQRGEGVRQDRNSRGDLLRIEATPEQLEVAQSVLDAVGGLVPDAAPPLYARIDLVRDDDGRPVLLELELAEPSLFLPQAPDAVARFTAAVRAELS